MSEEQREPIRVNGEEVSDALILQELELLRERYSHEMSYQEMDDKKDKIESDARENAVERVLLMQKARTEVLAVRAEEIEARFAALQMEHGGEEEFNKRFELNADDEHKLKMDIEDGIRLEKYFDDICKDAVRPGEADARAYYDAHPDAFNIPEQVHAAHIVQHPSPERPVEAVYASLLNVRERLLAGEEFDSLVCEFSECGETEADLGYFSRGQMVPSFEEVAFKTAVGTYSDVFQTEFGYHVLKVLDHIPEGKRAFDDVRYDIESMLFDERKNELIGNVADDLRAGATIENLVIVEQEL